MDMVGVGHNEPKYGLCPLKEAHTHHRFAVPVASLAVLVEVFCHCNAVFPSAGSMGRVEMFFDAQPERLGRPGGSSVLVVAKGEDAAGEEVWESPELEGVVGLLL
jgi:hypothetical protein